MEIFRDNNLEKEARRKKNPNDDIIRQQIEQDMVKNNAKGQFTLEGIHRM